MCLSQGGKDSTVLLDLVRRIYPDVPAVFIDTGLEYPELREFVKTIDNVIWLKPSMNFRKVIETFGYPIVSKRIAGYISSAKRIKGANVINVYYCYSSKLNQMPTSPDNLAGVGANDYESLIRIVSQIIGERLTKENFNLAKTITL